LGSFKGTRKGGGVVGLPWQKPFACFQKPVCKWHWGGGDHNLTIGDRGLVKIGNHVLSGKKTRTRGGGPGGGKVPQTAIVMGLVSQRLRKGRKGRGQQ